jgi:hypothetical protein
VRSRHAENEGSFQRLGPTVVLVSSSPWLLLLISSGCAEGPSLRICSSLDTYVVVGSHGAELEYRRPPPESIACLESRSMRARCQQMDFSLLPTGYPLGARDPSRVCWLVLQSDGSLCSSMSIAGALRQCRVASLALVLPWDSPCSEVNFERLLTAAQVEGDGETARSLLYAHEIGLLRLESAALQGLRRVAERTSPSQSELFRNYVVQQCDPNAVVPSIGSVRVGISSEFHVE